MENRRLIEETFPVAQVSEESVREKSQRQGNISTLHIWWARRPLASSRTTSFAALLPAPSDDKEKKRMRDLTIRLSAWGNSSDDSLIEEAKNLLLRANNGSSLRVLDPFAGGGAIPLEALRLGCETYASDYNPVAALLLLCTLDYPQKYGSVKRSRQGLVQKQEGNQLLEDVRKWAEWVLNETKSEISTLYPREPDGSVPVGFSWARTVRCQNPSCQAELPLLKQYWLSNKTSRRISTYPYTEGHTVRFKIVGTGYQKMPSSFKPDRGTVSKAIASCLVCGSTIDGEAMKSLFATKVAGEKMISVVLSKEGRAGKTYRPANDNDVMIYKRAEKRLDERRKVLLDKWGYDPIPDEPTPEGKGRGAERAFSVRNYSLNEWGDLFNARQKLTLITMVDKVRQAYDSILAEGKDKEYAKVIATYLAVLIDKVMARSNSLCLWDNTREDVKSPFDRQTLPMIWDYFETNPISETTGGFVSALRWMLLVIQQCSSISSTAKVSCTSATSIPYPDNFFDAVFTDPPYYDNVPYSYLSDFFYVWLKRSIGHLYPELFATPLTPKDNEIVAYSYGPGGFEEGKRIFEERLGNSFSEINRVLRQGGISVIVYAHKSTAGWETLVNSILSSGLVVTAAWPIHTEMRSRLRAKESAALASSIYMVARKFERQATGFYSEVKAELKSHLNSKLDQIWKEGISGADFFISAIGSAIEVFGRYDKVIDDEGNVIRADRLLEDIRRIVTDYAVKQVLHNGFASEIEPMTRFYVLWRWAYGDKIVSFDDARKLGQSVGIDVSQEWNRSFISKEKEFIEVVGPEGRDLGSLDDSTELIDILHRVLILWKKGKYVEVTDVLRESGYGKSDVFYRVAQAISESLEDGSGEKKLLEGFLSGKERVVKEVRRETGQTRLFE